MFMENMDVNCEKIKRNT